MSNREEEMKDTEGIVTPEKIEELTVKPFNKFFTPPDFVKLDWILHLLWVVLPAVVLVPVYWVVAGFSVKENRGEMSVIAIVLLVTIALFALLLVVDSVFRMVRKKGTPMWIYIATSFLFITWIMLTLALVVGFSSMAKETLWLFLFALGMLPPFYSMLKIIARLSRGEISGKMGQQVLPLVLVPLVWYLFVNTLLYSTKGMFAVIALLLTITATYFFIFLLLKVIYLIGRYSPKVWSVTKLIMIFVLPILCFIVTQTGSSFWFFWDYTSPIYYLLVILNGILLICPKPKTEIAGLVLFFARSIIYVIVTYFFVVISPFYSLSLVGLLFGGVGLLVLAPLFLWAYETKILFNNAREIFSKYGVVKTVSAIVAGFAVVPLVLFGSFLSEKSNLQKAVHHMDTINTANYSQVKINDKQLGRTLSFLASDQNQGLSYYAVESLKSGDDYSSYINRIPPPFITAFHNKVVDLEGMIESAAVEISIEEMKMLYSNTPRVDNGEYYYNIYEEMIPDEWTEEPSEPIALGASDEPAPPSDIDDPEAPSGPMTGRNEIPLAPQHAPEMPVGLLSLATQGTPASPLKLIPLTAQDDPEAPDGISPPAFGDLEEPEPYQGENLEPEPEPESEPEPEPEPEPETDSDVIPLDVEPMAPDIIEELYDIIPQVLSITTVKEQDYYKSMVNFSLTNPTKDGFMEFSQRIELPQGVFISDYYLDVLGERKEGLLAEVSSAKWIYDVITSRFLDPGLVVYTDNGISLKVFPFGAEEVRYTGIEFLYREPFSFQLDNLTIELDGGTSLSKPVEGDGVIFVSSEAKKRLTNVDREPFYVFAVDCSFEADVEKLTQQLEEFIESNNIPLNRATVSAINYNRKTWALTDNWKEELLAFPREGGFGCGLMKNQILREVDSRYYPVLIVLNDNQPNFIAPLTGEDMIQHSPEMSGYYELFSGNLIYTSFDGYEQSYHSQIAPPKDVKKLLVAGTTHYVVNDDFADLIYFEKPNGTISELTGNQWMDALNFLSDKHKIIGMSETKAFEGMLKVIKKSLKAEIMSPYTSFIVLELPEQEQAMYRRQEALMGSESWADFYENGGDSLLSDNEPDMDLPAMAEPELWLSLLMLLPVAMVYRRKKKRESQ